MAFIFVDKLFKEQNTYCASLLKDGKFITKQTSSPSVRLDGVDTLTFDLLTPNVCYDIRVLYELKAMKEFVLLRDVCKDAGIDCARYDESTKRVEAEIETYKQCNSRKSYKEIINDLDVDIMNRLHEEKSLLLVEILSKINDQNLLSYYKDFFFDKLKLIEEINNTYIELDSSFIDNNKGSVLLKLRGKERIKPILRATGSRNGRLHFKNEDFNFYIMQRHLRGCIKPKKGNQFWQLDYKSFQPRLAILGSGDPASERFKDVDDIYSLLPGNRTENKIKLIAWMFGEHEDRKIENEISFLSNFKEIVYQKMVNDGYTLNNFGRPIYYNGEKKNVTFQTYIVNLEVDCILYAMSKIREFLSSKKTKILLPYHDAIILDVNEEEVGLVAECRQIMATCLREKFDADFPVEVKKL